MSRKVFLTRELMSYWNRMYATAAMMASPNPQEQESGLRLTEEMMNAKGYQKRDIPEHIKNRIFRIFGSLEVLDRLKLQPKPRPVRPPPPIMTDYELKVLLILQFVGLIDFFLGDGKMAVSKVDLMKALGLSDRVARDCLARLGSPNQIRRGLDYKLRRRRTDDHRAGIPSRIEYWCPPIWPRLTYNPQSNANATGCIEEGGSDDVQAA